MEKKIVLFVFLFFHLQTSCMIVFQYISPKTWLPFLFQKKEPDLLDTFQNIPFSIANKIMRNLDYKSNIQFIRTHKRFYKNYVEKMTFYLPVIIYI